MMTFEEIRVLLSEKFGSEAVIDSQTSGLQSALFIHPDFIVPVCEELRDNQATWFDFLSCLTGVDHAPNSCKFSVVYHLSSIPHQHQLVLKVEIEHDRHLDALPSFYSISEVWKTAEWHEREAFDLVGIHFEGHPDQRRILLPDDWEGYPLRKDYIAAEEYKGIKIN